MTAKKRPSPITLRLTPEETARLDQMAGENRSAYIRSRLFDGGSVARSRRGGRAPVKDRQALSQLLGMLGASRIANNLNQLAYQANTDSLWMTPETEASLKEAYEDVRAMRGLLLKALGHHDASGGPRP